MSLKLTPEEIYLIVHRSTNMHITTREALIDAQLAKVKREIERIRKENPYTTLLGEKEAYDVACQSILSLFEGKQ